MNQFLCQELVRYTWT